MRLLILNQYGLPAGAQGITRHGDLGKALAERGHEVTVIASRFNYLTRTSQPSPGPSDEVLSGVCFRWLDTPSYVANDRRRVRSMLEYTLRATLSGARRGVRPDLVLASSPHLLTGFAGLALARRFRAPFVFEVRDFWPSALVDLGAIQRGGLLHRALETAERVLYRAASRIIIVPPLGARRVLEVGQDAAKCVHVPNAADLTDRRRAPLPHSLRSILDFEATRDIIMYTGAHGISNGLQNVIDAAGVLRERHPETYERTAFVFVGDGPLRTSLVQSARRSGHPHVHFHPAIEKGAVPDALAASTGLLVHFADLPVYGFGISPNKLFDYMAASRPVLLGSHLDTTPVDEARAGFRFEPGSPAALCETIHRLVSLPEQERAAMGGRGRALVERIYNSQAVAVKLEGLLDEVLAESRRR